ASMMNSITLYTFFFQAEDGIRDFHVTGVQTCALPIFPPTVRMTRRCRSATSPHLRATDRSTGRMRSGYSDRMKSRRAVTASRNESGRASCSESENVLVHYNATSQI